MMRCLPFAMLISFLAAMPAPAPGCASIPPRGESVEIAHETALIIWNEAAKTEHFIRQAKFQSTSPDFGFLVPTPSQPELAESEEAVFGQISAMTAPAIETRTVRMPRPRTEEHGSTMAMGAAMPKSATQGGVVVLERTEVGGMEATVLKFHRTAGADPAAGAKEVAEWLKKRGYEFGPTIAEWLKPYIANDWVMTAFRIARRVPPSTNPATKETHASVHEMQGKPIRMSFKTERPFYPYREPLAEKSKGAKASPMVADVRRFLRVYFLAKERFAGTLGTGSEQWVGKTAWSDKLTETQTQQIASAAKLPTGSLANSLWLTEFEDGSTPRKGTDEVYFGPAADQAALRRPPIYRDVIEYFDPPDIETETPYVVKLAAVLGGVLFIGVLTWLLIAIVRQR